MQYSVLHSSNAGPRVLASVCQRGGGLPNGRRRRRGRRSGRIGGSAHGPRVHRRRDLAGGARAPGSGSAGGRRRRAGWRAAGAAAALGRSARQACVACLPPLPRASAPPSLTHLQPPRQPTVHLTRVLLRAASRSRGTAARVVASGRGRLPAGATHSRPQRGAPFDAAQRVARCRDIGPDAPGPAPRQVRAPCAGAGRAASEPDQCAERRICFLLDGD